MEQVRQKRRYTKPEKINREYYTKTYEERLVQGFYYVKGKYKKEADMAILQLIKQWR